MEEKFVSNVATKTGVNPAIIQMIFAFIAQLLAGCTPKPTPAQLIAGHGGRGRILLFRAIKEGGGIPAWSADGRALHAAILTEAAATPEADMGEFMSACCQ